MRNWKMPQMSLLVVALAASTAACNSSNDAPPPQLAPATNNEPAPSPEKRNEMAESLEQSELDSAVPFVLTIDVPEHERSGNTITVHATIDAPRQLNAAASINVVLPKGASIDEGDASETMAYLPAGQTKRVFKVTGDFDAAKPVKVQVQVKDPNGAFGAYAERVFPEPPAAPVKPRAVPNPPVSRPGAGMKAAPGTRAMPQFRAQ